MSMQTNTPDISAAPGPALVDTTPRGGFIANLRIGTKLGIGFGVLIILFFISVLVSYLSSQEATNQIQTTDAVRVPISLTAATSQADLLRMLSDMRGYLALGEESYRKQYEQSARKFESDLAALENYSPYLDDESRTMLKELEAAYKEWQPLSETLFELRSDQLDREPAYRELATTGVRYAGSVLKSTNTLIEIQAQREPTEENLAILADMAKFQGNFSAMLSALRGYVTTRNRIYRGEYEVNLTDNTNVWGRLQEQRSKLTQPQQDELDKIAANRESFVTLPENIFTVLESERWREDLYLFTNQAVPLADRMQLALNKLVENQQGLLTDELADGRQTLNTANRIIVAGGLVALVIGLLMTFSVQQTIARPIRKLTSVAEQIRSGDLGAKAHAVSRDEIGTLATTFNSMTAKLRQTLNQVRKEKRRADDLLEVVIPIGIELSTERDFNQLLEKMLLEAKNFCNAAAGMLYLRNKNDRLTFAILRNDPLGISLGGTSGHPILFSAPAMEAAQGERPHVIAHVAQNGETVNLTPANIGDEYGVSLSPDDPADLKDYEIQSLLALPLKNSTGQVLGVLELVNPRDADTGQVIAFDANLQQMMESFSSLAVAALEAYIREQALKQEIEQLRIEVDEAKRQSAVSEIVDSDFFQNISVRAGELRRRRKGLEGDSSAS